MAAAPVPGYQAFSAEKRASLQAEYKTLIENYPDADTQYRQLFKVLCSIEDVAGYTPAVVGESTEWTAIVSAAEENRTNFCKALSGKTLFSALYGTYIVTLNDLKAILRTSNSAGKTTEKPSQEEGFQEVRRRKRHSTTKTAPTSKKAMPTAASAAASTPQKEVATGNFFTPLRATEMDTDSASNEATSCKETPPGKTGRPPPNNSNICGQPDPSAEAAERCGK
jgi:hypothetical protein